MSGALALRPDQQDWNEVQRAALVQLGIDKAPRGDQLVFLHVCQRMGLDPFNREIYMIGRKDEEQPSGKKWTIQVGIDGFRLKSEQHPEYAGVGDAEWCGPDGQWVEVWLSDEPPRAARFTVYRKDWTEPVRAVAMWKEYAQYKLGGQLTSMWKTRPAGQLAKCAEALARRKAFPRTLGGVHIQEELDHLSNPAPITVPSERVDQPAEPDWDALIREHESAGDVAKLWDLRKLAQGMRPNDGPLLNRIAEAWSRAKKAAAIPTEPAPTPDPVPDPASARPAAADPTTQPANQSQMRRIFTLLKNRGIGEDGRLAAASMALQRDITSFKDLTTADASRLIVRLEQADQQQPDPQPDQTPAEQPAGEGA